MTPTANPIEGMPGGSVSGCIKQMKRTRKDIDDPGAYCAAIADRIEPGWRKKNPDLRFILRGTKEWDRMWSEVDDDPTAYDPTTGEVWQYMGTVKKNGGWAHQFRHRHHPVEKRRVYREVPASSGWIAAERKEYRQGLEAINRRRQALGMRPLDPVAAGWTPQDVIFEAKRLVANPSAKPKEQLGLFGEKQAEVEGFALTHPEAEPVGRFQTPRGRQERFFEDKPDPEVMEAIRRRELAERRKKRKKRKKNADLITLKRRLSGF